MGVLWDRLLCQQGIFNRLEQYQIKVDNLNHFPIFCDIMCRYNVNMVYKCGFATHMTQLNTITVDQIISNSNDNRALDKF